MSRRSVQPMRLLVACAPSPVPSLGARLREFHTDVRLRRGKHAASSSSSFSPPRLARPLWGEAASRPFTVGRQPPGHVQISEDRLREFLQAEVYSFAARDAQSLSLRNVLDASTPLLAGRLTLAELPVRFAQRIQQIEELQNWRSSPELTHVHELYADAFRKVRLVEGHGADANMYELTEVIETVKRQMQGVVPKLATGMRALKHSEGFGEQQINDWLDAFFLSRIGTEMLTSQYLATLKPSRGGRKQTGIVDNACDPAVICEQAARHAQKLCKQHSGMDVKIAVERAGDGGKETGIRFPYVPQYLFYVMVELLKNSARATAEACPDPSRIKEFPVVVTVGADQSEVGIRVHDLAGGIDFSDRHRVWSYMYSTVRKNTGGNRMTQEGTPLAGYGVGLPLSRLYARYLGGSLHLMSLPGIGTSAYLHLKRIVTEAREEHIPRKGFSSLFEDPSL